VLENQKEIVELAAEKVWKFFSSVKLAVVLLIILAIVSVIGTVIQQNEAPERYYREYSEATVRLFDMLGFFDMYHTWWFVLLLFLFTANLTVCTLERFPHTWKIVKAPLKPIDEDGLKALAFKQEIQLGEGREAAEAKAASVLKARGFRFIESHGPDSAQLITQKGVFSRFGVYITHVSILLIFVGALMGSFFGFKAFINLPEGSATRVVYLRNEPLWDQIMAALGVAESPVINDPQVGVPAMPLGYYVRCDNFDVDYYVGRSGMPTGMPSEYHSTLSVFDQNGQKILDKTITVNNPLTYHGITFYQSSYGSIPEARGKVVLKVRKKSDPSSGEAVVVDPGASAYVASIDRTIKVVGFEPYGVRNPMTGEIAAYHTENNEYINPTVGIEIYRGHGGGKPLYQTTIMKTDSAQPLMPEDYVISYGGYVGARYTGLQVTKDPGVWVVYAGFIMLCVGPPIAFFGSHRKLWVRIQDRKGQAAVLVAGSANRNRVGFEREFNRIVEDLSK
jgi:cytochrome c biogenesis protein